MIIIKVCDAMEDHDMIEDHAAMEGNVKCRQNHFFRYSMTVSHSIPMQQQIHEIDSNAILAEPNKARKWLK